MMSYYSHHPNFCVLCLIMMMIGSNWYHVVQAQAVIGNGKVILGVNLRGDLLIPYVGDVLGLPLTNPLCMNRITIRNHNGTFSGQERGRKNIEGWGASLSNNGGDACSVTKYVEQIVHNMQWISFQGLSGSSSATSVVGCTTNRMEIIHEFKPSTSPDLMQVNITIANKDSIDFNDVKYRQGMDWDIDPPHLMKQLLIWESKRHQH
jgi:hypothetical protein